MYMHDNHEYIMNNTSRRQGLSSIARGMKPLDEIHFPPSKSPSRLQRNVPVSASTLFTCSTRVGMRTVLGTHTDPSERINWKVSPTHKARARMPQRQRSTTNVPPEGPSPVVPKLRRVRRPIVIHLHGADRRASTQPRRTARPLRRPWRNEHLFRLRGVQPY